PADVAIDGDGAGRILWADHCDSLRIEGLTFRNGRGALYFEWCYEYRVRRCAFIGNVSGYVAELEPAGGSFEDCSFRDNHTSVVSASMGDGDSGLKNFEDCAFLNNAGRVLVLWTADARFERCRFEGNGQVANAEDASSVDFRTCEIVNNRGATSGVIDCHHTHLTMIDCLLAGNLGLQEAGAITISVSNHTLMRCAFIGNIGGEAGALMLDYTAGSADSCLFLGNQGLQAGAIFCNRWFSSSSALDFANCTFARNVGPAAIRCIENSPTFGACLVSGNLGIAIHCDDDESAPALACCDLFGNAGGDWTGCVAGQADLYGNFSADPRFCNLAGGDLRLAGDSPCLPEHNDCAVLVGALGLGCHAAVTACDDTGAAGGLAFSVAPNPCGAGGARLRCEAPAGAAIRVDVLDVAGRRCRRLVLPAGAAGPRTFAWDGRDDAGRPLASGVYLLRVEAGGIRETRRVVLLR
ncbi:MAG: hypothetical protein JW819_00575, partial [Candidatus Krumholzibacteriota bacterium]|nr:hypothetical protein [Candidatus Krumholzibacteriota bacterium]